MTKSKANKPSFEQSLERLETLIESMEKGDIPLDKLIDHFEEGSALIKGCEEALQKASVRIDKVLGNSDEGLVLEPFTGNDIE